MPTVSAPSSRAISATIGAAPRSGTAAFAGGHEHHVRAAQRSPEGIASLLCRASPDVGVSARAQAFGDVSADVDLRRRIGALERLDIGVHGHELDLVDAGVDHAVDRVQPGAADADDADDRDVRARVGSGRRLERRRLRQALEPEVTADALLLAGTLGGLGLRLRLGDRRFGLRLRLGTSGSATSGSAGSSWAKSGV